MNGAVLRFFQQIHLFKGMGGKVTFTYSYYQKKKKRGGQEIHSYNSVTSCDMYLVGIFFPFGSNIKASFSKQFLKRGFIKEVCKCNISYLYPFEIYISEESIVIIYFNFT